MASSFVLLSFFILGFSIFQKHCPLTVYVPLRFHPKHTVTVSSNFEEKHNSIQKTLYLTWLFTQREQVTKSFPQNSFAVPPNSDEWEAGAVKTPTPTPTPGKEQVYCHWCVIQTRCSRLQRASPRTNRYPRKDKNKK